MSMRSPNRKRVARSVAAVLPCLAAAVMLAGCAPRYGSRPDGYYGGQSGGYYGNRQQCYQGCGYVRDIREVRLRDRNDSGAVLGTVIGAVLGGVVGHQVGKGDGRKAATVAGAVAGGIAGHAIGERAGQGDRAWQIVVQLRDGRYATVTQRGAPRVQVGDYAIIRGDEVYRY